MIQQASRINHRVHGLMLVGVGVKGKLGREGGKQAGDTIPALKVQPTLSRMTYTHEILLT